MVHFIQLFQKINGCIDYIFKINNKVFYCFNISDCLREKVIHTSKILVASSSSIMRGIWLFPVTLLGLLLVAESGKTVLL